MNIIKYAVDRGAENVIVERVSDNTKQIRFDNNTMSIFNDWKTNFNKIFLSVKGKTLNTIVFKTDEASIKKAIDDLIKSSKFVLSNTNFSEIASGPFEYKQIPKIYDKKMESIEETDFINAAINGALENSKITAGSFYSSITEKEIETSGNVSSSEKSTSIQISIRAFNEDEESGHAVSCARTLDEFYPEEVGRKAGTISKMAKNPAVGKTGNFNVIFDPLAIGNILGSVGSSASIFYVESGLSFLKDKIDHNVASDMVNLTDDGTISGGFGSTKFDAEGVPTRRTEIIKDGIFKTYLHNTSSAKKYNTKTTGNAGIISPMPINIILEPGKKTKEEIFKEIDKGIYITNVWYTRFQNYMSGDFSTIPRDGIFEIQNGEIIGSLKNIRITENLEKMLMNIRAISNKPEWIHWWGLDSSGAPILTPFVLIESVNITKPTM